MNNDYLNRALEQINDKNLLVNVTAKRASEIANGAHPLIDVPANTPILDIALLEIAEKKVVGQRLKS